MASKHIRTPDNLSNSHRGITGRKMTGMIGPLRELVPEQAGKNLTEPQRVLDHRKRSISWLITGGKCFSCFAISLVILISKMDLRVESIRYLERLTFNYSLSKAKIRPIQV